MSNNPQFGPRVARSALFANQKFHKTSAKSHDYLVCRRNRDFFYLHDNIVRCEKIGISKQQCYILGDQSLEFEACKLILNHSGTLLAVQGEENISIFTLPETLNSNDQGTIRTHRYDIKITNTITKMVFQPGMANDATIVILTKGKESKILVYDLMISTSEPQLEIQQDSIVSMAFGSSKYLSGCLTLYLMKQSGDIYCLYPFLHPAAKIKASRSHIRKFYDEAKSLQTHGLDVLADFECPSLINSLKDTLNNHVGFALSLLNQITRPIEPRMEGNQYILEPLDVSQIDYKIQGPIASVYLPAFDPNTSSVADLAFICNNEECNVLAVLHGPQISFSAQFSPLLTSWKPVNEKKIVVKTPRVKAYKAANLGFGYVDDNGDEELLEEVDADEAQQTKNEVVPISYEKELAQWNDHFQHLSVLETNELGISLNYLKLNEDGNSFIAYSGTSIVYVQCKALTQYVETLRSLGTPFAEFMHVPTPGTNNSIQLVIEDIVTDEGTFIVYMDAGAINVKCLTFDQKKQVSKPSESSLEKSDTYISPLQSRPFAELSVSLSKVANKNITQGTKYSQLPKMKATKSLDTHDVEVISVLNEISVNTIRNVSEFTDYALKFKARLSEQLSELNYQVKTLNELENPEPITSELEDKVKKLVDRQSKIDSRIEKLQNKTITALEAQYTHKDLPLSKEERQWFLELNNMVSQVNINDKEGDNIASAIKNLEADAKIIIDNAPLQQDFNQKKFFKLIDLLKKKGTLIEHTKKNLDGQMEALDRKIEISMS